MACCWRRRRRKIIRIMLIGLNGAGKTSLVRYLLKDPSNILPPTMGYSCHDLRRYGNFSVKIIDVGGGKTIRGIWKNYFPLVHGFLLVIDSHDVARIDQVKELLRETLSDDKVGGKPLLVLVNKQDIESALDECDISRLIDLNHLVNLHECPTKVESCSLLNRWGNRVHKNALLDRGFFWLLNFITNNWEKLNERVELDTQQQIAHEKQIMDERIRRLRGSKKNSVDNECINGQLKNGPNNHPNGALIQNPFSNNGNDDNDKTISTDKSTNDNVNRKSKNLLHKRSKSAFGGHKVAPILIRQNSK